MEVLMKNPNFFNGVVIFKIQADRSLRHFPPKLEDKAVRMSCLGPFSVPFPPASGGFGPESLPSGQALPVLLVYGT